MTGYEVRHEVCPCCGATGPFEATTLGGIITPDANGKPPRDRNRHTCSVCLCKWRPAEILSSGLAPGEFVFAQSGPDDDGRWHIQRENGESLCGLAPRDARKVSCPRGSLPFGATCGECLVASGLLRRSQLASVGQ